MEKPTKKQYSFEVKKEVVDVSGGWHEGLFLTDHGFKRLEHSGTRVVGIPVNEVHVYLVKECDHVA
ncbi:hypothetical protein EBF03_00320 [Arcanobacterium haemolyticum]|uniref:hypothetical protein n=1 Tax=Arcanobacterium haemolyticum TaxID=28264 RepID=UPI001110026F|nr:hypothetical protein EBF03_00320 [Arcanobacterium haemolyticum]